MRRSISRVLGLVAATSLLTACGSSTSQPTPAQPTTAPASPETPDAEAPEFPAGTGRQIVDHEGAWDLVLRDVEVSHQDGFDRVVIELAGSGTPGWGAQYVRTPRAEGSGEVVHLRGDRFLGISISGVTIRKGYPQTPADFFRGARHFAPDDSGVIEEVDLGGVFEGYSQLFLGLHGDRVPFRIFALTDPSRLVVDVQDS